MTRFWKTGPAALISATILSACSVTGGGFGTDQTVQRAFEIALGNLNISDCSSLTKTQKELGRIRTGVATANTFAPVTGKRLNLPPSFEGELTRIESVINQSQCGGSNLSRRY